MSYQKWNKSCLYHATYNFVLIFFVISQLGRYSVLSDQINSSNEYEDIDNSLDDSINLVDSVGEWLKSSDFKSSTDDNLMVFWAKLTSDLSDKLWDKLLPIFVKFRNSDINITHECVGSLFKVVMSARKQQTWALKFIDSIGKPSSGLLEGTVTSFGNMDECTDIVVGEDSYDEGFYGKYCLLYLRTRLPPKPIIIRHNDLIFNMSGTEAEGTVFEHLANISTIFYSIDAFRIGICLPSNCQNWEIKPLLTKFLSRYRIIPDLSKKCLSKYDIKELNEYQKVSIILISSMASLAFIATLFDWMVGSKVKNILMRLLRSWSVIKNFNLLLNLQDANRNLRPLYGIKVLTIYWMAFNHTYMFGGFYQIQWTYKSVYNLKDVPKSLMFQLVFNGWPLVETLFFINGFLFIYITLPQIEENDGKPNFFVLILHRLLRIVPTLSGVIAINFLWPLFTSGPILIDDTIDAQLIENCQKNWWKTLLLINNWFDPTHICLFTTWYSSADFQLFMCALIILFALYWNKTFGLILNGTVLITSIIYSVVITYTKQLYPTILDVDIINIDHFNNHLKYGYFPFYRHLAPLSFGIFIGYLTLKSSDFFKISKTKNRIAWICFPLINLCVLLSTYGWNNGLEISTISSVLYSSMSVTLWCFALSWITYNSCLRREGIIDRILSHPILLPLSRLSFGAYLAQLLVIHIIFFTRKSVTDWTHFDFLCNGIITIILSNIISLVLFLLLDAPFVNLKKEFLDINEHRVLKKSLIQLKQKYEIKNKTFNRNSLTNISQTLESTKM